MKRLMLAIITTSFLNLLMSMPAHAVGSGEDAPSFSLPSNRSFSLDLKDYSGKLVYLDFWASWCATCATSFAWMQSLQEKYAKDGFQVITINVDEKRALADRFLNSVRSDLLVGFDPRGSVPEAYQIAAMPTSYLIAPDGKVLSVHPGFSEKDAEKIELEIVNFLKHRGGKDE